jgi:hypothetical protein
LIAAAKAGECEILLEEREKRFDCVLFEYSTHTRRITITRTAEPPT